MTRDLESLFDRARRDAADEAERRRGNLEQMRRSLSAFDPDSEDFLRREQELTRNEIDFQVWSKSTDRRLKSDHLRWMKKIYRNTQDTIATLARERNLDLVLTYDELADDAPDSVALRQQILLQKVIYHDARVDITDEVLNRLNTTYRNSGGHPFVGFPRSGGGDAAHVARRGGRRSLAKTQSKTNPTRAAFSRAPPPWRKPGRPRGMRRQRPLA
jgi:Skp family chaperone for outer membrane proteins